MTDGQNSKKGSDNKGSDKNAGGFFLAAGCIVGVVVGSLLGQPSIGFLGGLAAGALIAIGVWFFDRRNDS